MTEFSPTPSSKEKTYTEGQQFILDKVWEYGGDPVATAKAYGYSNPYAAVDSVREELIEIAEKAFARLSLKSVREIERVLDSDGDVKQANEKLKAAQLILDRTNPKTDRLDVNVETQTVFILPEKRALDEPPEV